MKRRSVRKSHKTGIPEETFFAARPGSNCSGGEGGGGFPVREMYEHVPFWWISPATKQIAVNGGPARSTRLIHRPLRIHRHLPQLALHCENDTAATGHPDSQK